MPNNPAYDPTDPRYYDAKDLRSEAERIFSLCADCRLCVRYCGSFPKLFDAVDNYCTDEKYSEVDTKKLKTRGRQRNRRSLFPVQALLDQMSLHSRQSRVGHRLSQVDGARKSQAGKGQGRTVGGQGAGSYRRRRKVGYGDVAACQLGQRKWLTSTIHAEPARHSQRQETTALRVEDFRFAVFRAPEDPSGRTRRENRFLLHLLC